MKDNRNAPDPEGGPVTVDGRSPAALHRARAAGHRVAAGVSSRAGQLAVRADMLQMKVLPTRFLVGRVRTAEEDPEDWRFLWRPALLGFLALTSVVVGASLTSSPFKLDVAGTWFFGVPAHLNQSSNAYSLFGLVAVYGGLILLMRVWYGLIKALTRRPGVAMRHLWWILALWMLPMLVVAPIFSRDVFSYAAQGEMVSRHINPYVYGPQTLGGGPFVVGVDNLWANTPAPYGPLFLIIDGFFATVSFHHVLVMVILLRLLALAGVVLIAWCIPKLARLYGRDPGPVFVLAVLNPLVVLTLVGAAHNDAIMVGLLVAGITAAKSRHPVWGVVLCALAAAIKAPAALGILYVAWEWTGTSIPLRQRVRPILSAALIALAVLVALTYVSGLGFGWVANLETPGTVRSWLAPATGIGMFLGWLAHLVGLSVSSASVLSVTRVLGLLGAVAAGVWLLKESDRIGALTALGLSLLLFVVLGPVVQPWYLTWGLILLAPVATGRMRSMIIVVSVVAPFIGLPGGHQLLLDLVHYSKGWVAVALTVLLLVIVAPLGRWSNSWSWESGDERSPAVEPAGPELATG